MRRRAVTQTQTHDKDNNLHTYLITHLIHFTSHFKNFHNLTIPSLISFFKYLFLIFSSHAYRNHDLYYSYVIVVSRDKNASRNGNSRNIHQNPRSNKTKKTLSLQKRGSEPSKSHFLINSNIILISTFQISTSSSHSFKIHIPPLNQRFFFF